MKIDVLKDLLIEANELDRYFEGSVPINLWRAIRKEPSSVATKANHVFDLYYEDTILSNGKVRRPDIRVEIINGVKWVQCKERPRGGSTFDKPGAFGHKHWDYYKIPAGVELPNGLAIVRDEFNEQYGAVHYTIAPAWDMPLANFQALLNILATRIIAAAA